MNAEQQARVSNILEATIRLMVAQGGCDPYEFAEIIAQAIHRVIGPRDRFRRILTYENLVECFLAERDRVQKELDSGLR